MPGEPRELVLGETIEMTENTNIRGGGRGKGKGGKGMKGFGKGQSRVDWRNMSEEERAERRRQFMDEMDKNKDGNLGKDEVPERMWSFMGRADKDGNDQISPKEREEFRAEMQAQREVRELTGESMRPGGGGRGPRDGGGGGDRRGGGDSR